MSRAKMAASRFVSADRLGHQALASRERMKRAARRLINQHGYSSLRVEDIAAEAGSAKGLFYRYFKDRYDITLELCRDVFAQIERDSEQIPHVLHLFDWFCQYALTPIRSFCSNPGLLACMFELHGEFPEISRAWKDTSRRWNLALANVLAERAGVSRKGAADIALVLAAMMEGIIYQDLVRNVEDLQALGKDPEQIAEIVAIVWYRTVLLELPPASKVRFESRLLGKGIRLGSPRKAHAQQRPAKSAVRCVP
ncbi:MAG: TetR/AcrR family transcriptional regulator [Steroidobacteraceae bacterium]